MGESSRGEWTIDGVLTAALPLLAFVALTAANAGFVAAEFSLVTVDRAEIERRVQAGDRSARTVAKALRELVFQLSGAQLGITITALLAGFLAEPALAKLFVPLVEPVMRGAAEATASVLALVVATLFSMLFGELLPKNAALARPLPLALRMAGPQRAFSKAFAWLIHLLNGSANWVVRRLGIEPQEELASARSPEELGLLAVISARAGALPAETAVLLQRTIRFGDKRAAEAMTPRVDMVALPADATIADLLRTARETGHSRFPVYVDTVDQIVGVVTVKDALSVPPARRDTTALRAVAREPVFVPESLDLDGVLHSLQAADSDIAIVVDEYGGTDGMVTTEDLVEELVGEIADEHDIEPAPGSGLEPARGLAETGSQELFLPEADGAGGHEAVLVDGMMREDELYERTGFRMPDGPYETLAGFLMARLGHIPIVGEMVTEDGREFTVVDVNKRRVEQVRVSDAAEDPR